MRMTDFNYGLGGNLASLGSYGQPVAEVAGYGIGQPLMQGGLSAVGNSLSYAGSGAGVLNPSFMDKMLGYTNQNGVQQQGWGGLALGAAQGISSAFMGMKQYGLAKDALKENKRQFNTNYEAQRTLTNSQLEDRQRARVAANAGAYQSVGDYMDQNRIK